MCAFLLSMMVQNMEGHNMSWCGSCARSKDTVKVRSLTIEFDVTCSVCKKWLCPMCVMKRGDTIYCEKDYKMKE